MILSKTLHEIFLNLRNCEDAGITFINNSDTDKVIRYSELFKRSLNLLGSLQKKGLTEGNELVFQLQDSQSFIETFWACILGEIIPVPVNFAVTNDLRTKLSNIFSVLKSPYLITSKENYHLNLKKDLRLDNLLKGKVLCIDELEQKGLGIIKNALPDDLAYIQFSSGSTGTPKGVMLTHRNLITNIDSIHNGINSPVDGDLFYSWMPLTHDMGLIGFHLTPMAKGWNHYIMPTELFMRNPSLWLRKITEYKISFTSSPNFGYQYVLKHFNPEKSNDINLSSLRIIVNGAEPISLDICNKFNKYFKEYGLKENAIFPVYGLAEASLAVTFSGPEDEIYSIELNRNKLSLGSQIGIVENEDSSVQFVGVGRQIKNTFIRLVDGGGNILENNFVGKIQIKGDNVTSGYYNNTEATQKLISKDGWLNTGDLGFKDKNGNLYIVGRDKDIIFVNGGNFYSHDLERIAEKVEGIELGKIVVAGNFNAKLSRDEIIAFVLYRGKLENFIEVVQACRKTISEETGIQIDIVLPVKNIPKTTSGKVQRFKLLEEYGNGYFDGIKKELDGLVQQISKGEKILPQNKKEEEILKIWQEVLGVAEVNSNDDFFVLGGNSLKAGQLVMKLQDEIGIDISLESLYRERTINDILRQSNEGLSEEKIKIEPSNLKEYNLSQAQNRIFYYSYLNKDSIAYNIPLAFQISGDFDINKLKDAILNLICRHDILRTTFHIKGDTPYQLIHDEPIISFEQIKLNNGYSIESQLGAFAEPFDLEKLPLIRVKSGILQSGQSLLFIDVHHIIADGTSVIKLIDELLKLYNGEDLVELNYQYLDYVIWEEKYLKSGKAKVHKEYWLNGFKDRIPQLNLPYDFPRLNIDSKTGAKVFGMLGIDLNKCLEQFCIENEFSKSVVLLTSYSLLLNKLTGHEDVVIGVAESGRNQIKFIDAVGMFVNNLPVRISPDGGISIKEYLRNANDQFVLSFNNKAFPYNKIIESLNIKSIQGRNPLFDTMFVYHNMDMPEFKKGNFSLSHIPLDPNISKFDLSLEIIEGDELNYSFEYSASLFKKDTIERFSRCFEKLVYSVIHNMDTLIKDIVISSENEYSNLILDYNNTEINYPKILIHELIEQQAERIPGECALECGNTKIIYKELIQKADKFAGVLLSKGVQIEDFIAIIAEQSIGFVVSVLAVLKAGAAFVPIDVNNPSSRKDYILNDCNARFIITTRKQKDKNEACLTSLEDKILYIEDLESYKENASCKDVYIGLKNLAYMIYTSGTTGKPKGVMIEHGNLLNYIWWANKVYVKGEKRDFPLFTSIAFDLTITSIFTPLISGNTLIIYSEDSQDLLIEKVLMDDKVGVIKLTPSHLRIIKDDYKIKADKIKNLKCFIVGGEDLSSELAGSIFSMFHNNVEIYNEYGPTEATVGCMIHKFDSKDSNRSVPIGKPAENASIFLLDKYLKPVIQGVVGEIYIGGKGIARGYLNNENLTNEKFVFIPEINAGKLYKTGDLGRFLEDGLIEFSGRVDHQVKINGYRVELDEIELCMKGYEGIIDVVILVVNRNGTFMLSAYYTTRHVTNENDIRLYMQKHLPNYMIPSLYFNIDSIPLTQNGKIDKEALLKLDILPKKETEFNAENEMQELLIGIFREVLNLNNIGINDNFFELGGDSIKAVQITSRLYEKGMSLNVKDILTYQTISQISLYAEKSEKEYEQGIVSGEKTFSPIESWFFSHSFTNPNYYNQSVLLEFKKPINKIIIEEVFYKLIEHHDGLRLNYNPIMDCMFFNNDHLNNKFEIEEITINDSNTIDEIGKKVKSTFNIQSSLLVKVVVLKQEGVSDKLLITAHHLVIDGVSWRILLEDFRSLYIAKENGKDLFLPKKTGSLINYQDSIIEYSQKNELQDQIEYWRDIENTEFNLFDAKKDANTLTREPERFQLFLGNDKTEFLLKEANESYNTDIQILLITALTLVLNKWSNSNMLVIELENFGRLIENVDVSRTVGWFTAIYPLKFNVLGEDIGSNIKHVKEQIRKVPDNGIGYGINKFINKELNETYVPKSEVRFNYLGQFGQEVSNDLFKLLNDFTGNEASVKNHLTANLEVNSLVIGGELSFEMIYNSGVFSKDDIVWITENFEIEIENIISYLKNVEDIHFTPSDFEFADIDEEDLDILFK